MQEYGVDWLDVLDQLPAGERCACLIAERVLGVRAEAWDVGGRQGAVDAYLNYGDGRRAAFEVTTLADDGAQQLDVLLARDNHSWPLPGRWWWSVNVGDVRELPRLKASFNRVVLLCERFQVCRPRQLPLVFRQSDPDIQWLARASTVTMVGHPSVPAQEGDRVRSAMVVTAARGGFADGALVGLRDALAEALERPHLRRRVAKLLHVQDADEHHLFVAVHVSGLAFPVFDGLAFGDQLPRVPPPLPKGITDLWLAPDFGRRVLLWHSGRWSQHEPYDEMR